MTVSLIRRYPFLGNWKFIILILAPILLLPIIFVPEVPPWSPPPPTTTTENTLSDNNSSDYTLITELYSEDDHTTPEESLSSTLETLNNEVGKEEEVENVTLSRVRRSNNGAFAWRPPNSTLPSNSSAKSKKKPLPPKKTTAINPRNKFKCAYVIILMAIYWMIEALPLAVTALLPVVLFPLLGVQDTTKVSLNYMKESNMMFIGGLILALAVEYSGLHQRIALRVMTLVGSSPQRLLFGVMLTTMVLSMWISNTAATALMIPIVLSILQELHKSSPDEFNMNVMEGARGTTSLNSSLDSMSASTGTGISNPSFEPDEEPKRVGLGKPTDSINTLRPEPGFESGFGSKLTPFHKYLLTLPKFIEEVALKRLFLNFMYAVAVGANLGGVIWPFAAISTSLPLYWLTKADFIPPLLPNCTDLASRGSNWTCPIPLKPGITLDYRRKRTELFGPLTENNNEPSPPGGSSRSRLRTAFFLGVAYASNLGGTGTTIGTPPNLVLTQFLLPVDVGQGGKYTDLTFATWMAFAVPGMLICVLIAWIYLIVMFFGTPSFLKSSKGKSGKSVSKNSGVVNRILREKYNDLGRMTFHEWSVALLFLTVIFLWFFRDPRFIDGWAELIKDVRVGDSTAAMLVVIFLFIIPKNFKFLDGVTDGGKIQTLLDWKYVQSNLPWAIILLMGGGFALSDAAEHSGLSEWLGVQLNGLGSLPNPVILLLVMLLAATLTEVASNTATANILLPILITLSKRLQIHPIYLTFPVAISCSFAFMLPVASPPNALVYAAAGDMKITQMVKVGWLLNVTCLAVVFLLNLGWGTVLFDYGSYVYPPRCTQCPDLSLNRG